MRFSGVCPLWAFPKGFRSPILISEVNRMKCPVCGKPLKVTRGIEVGNIFQLGTKYSKPMNAVYLDQNGKTQPYIMGCYGIGISRTAAAAVEAHYDENEWMVRFCNAVLRLC